MNYYYAVCSCRKVREDQIANTKSSYFSDFWTDDLEISILPMKEEEKEKLQIVYLELSKLIFLPFLYGYGWSYVIKSFIHKNIMFDLKKIEEKAIPSLNDTADVIKIINDVSNEFVSHEIS